MSLDDPRNPSLEQKVTLPATWSTSESDLFGSSGMFMAGAVMVTRNRYLGWPAAIMGINSFINQHPLRVKESGNAWQSLLMGFGALITGYLPLLIQSQKKATEPSPLEL